MPIPRPVDTAQTANRLRRGLNPAEAPQGVATMARTACFSRRHFHRLTLQMMGETPGAHQRRVRLDRGAWLLLNSRATVLEIALETGWESHETFTRAFRAQFGVTPSALRKNRGVTLPRSIRIAFGIAMNAVDDTATQRRGYPSSFDSGVAGSNER